MRRVLRPIPQEKINLVGWAGEPVLIIFARGLLNSLIDLKSPKYRRRVTRIVVKFAVSNVRCALHAIQIVEV